MEKDYDFVYHDTVDFINCIISDYDFYSELLTLFQSDSSQISLHKKQLKKQIDETWLLAIEHALPSLDMAIRSPKRHLKETEEVLPIELSHNISAKSIRHLAQHTDYIASVEGDVITPSKILNVFVDETIETYENKFIYTLIDRLFLFVERRYVKLLEYGADESSTLMNFETELDSEQTLATLKFSIEIKDKNPDKANDGEKRGLSHSSMWERVEKIRSILAEYLNSDLAKELKGKFIRPPVMRTNAITKNKDLKTCLELWEFIESYDKIGYELSVSETAEKPDMEYINELYSLLALQYVVFRYNVDGGLDQEKALASLSTDRPLVPKIITDLKAYEADEFNVYDVQLQKYVRVSQTTARKRLTAEEIKIRQAVDTALAADKKLQIIELQRLKEEERLRQQQIKEEEQRRRQMLKEQEEQRQRLERLKEKKKRRSKKGRTEAKRSAIADKKKRK